MKYLTKEQIATQREYIKSELANLGQAVRDPFALGLVREYVPDPASAIMDCGCGSGAFLEALSGAGYRNLAGADIDNYLDEPIAGLLRNFAKVDLNVDPLPSGDATLDAVTAWEVFEHLENPHHAIREVHRVLKPGGYFLLSMPNVAHLWNRIFFLRRADMFRWRASNNHIAVFPHGLFSKSFFPYFDLRDTCYREGELPYRLFSRFSFPKNKWFGRDAFYILRKK